MVKHTIVINMNKKTSLKSLSRFLQILDGTFPSGVFVHSFGLEPHIIKQSVKDINTLNIYLRNLIIDQYSKIEFVCIKKVYEALRNNKLLLINKLDKEYNSYLTYEYTKTSINIGNKYYTHIKKYLFLNQKVLLSIQVFYFLRKRDYYHYFHTFHFYMLI